MTSTLGYTAGIAERMYKEFVDGTYLDVETYKNVTNRQQAVDKFTEEYDSYTDDEEGFINEEVDYLSGDDYELIANLDGTYTVTQSVMSFVDDLTAGGFSYKLKDHYTEDGEVDNEYYDNEYITVDDFEWIKLGVAGEHMGDISIWIDPINETIGARDFEERSISKYDGDIYDQLQYLVEEYILLEVNKTY